jgi:hypothetical protein
MGRLKGLIGNKIFFIYKSTQIMVQTKKLNSGPNPELTVATDDAQ